MEIPTRYVQIIKWRLLQIFRCSFAKDVTLFVRFRHFIGWHKLTLSRWRRSTLFTVLQWAWIGIAPKIGKPTLIPFITRINPISDLVIWDLLWNRILIYGEYIYNTVYKRDKQLSTHFQKSFDIKHRRLPIIPTECRVRTWRITIALPLVEWSGKRFSRIARDRIRCQTEQRNSFHCNEETRWKRLAGRWPINSFSIISC